MADLARTISPSITPEPLIEGPDDDLTLTDSVFAPVWKPTAKGWWFLFMICLGGTGMLFSAIGWTVYKGIGVWGNNIPVAWAFGIINFVWWIGIGHAGTLISAILLLFQQKWRTSINRFSEAMTLFAVICAALYPVVHTGRPWFAAYWLFPYPSTLGIWPQFRSPLTWDVFAVSTYFTTSLLFWYLGLLPDLAALRDRSTGKWSQRLYGIFSLGWRGAGRHWRDYMSAYTLLAGVATPLVVSVHTIVSFDFATAQLPGWHTTIFPPYFVAGAVFSGFAMVVTLIVPAREFLGLKNVITLRHLEAMNKVILATGWIVAYGYAVEIFNDWYSGSRYELGHLHEKMLGPFAPFFWMQMFCNVVVPQIFWKRSLRRSLLVMWIASIFVNIGMWLERFNIIVISLHRDFIPGSWAAYAPTIIDVSLFVGTICFFGMNFLLFLRFVPSVAANEVKELAHEMRHTHV
ncbi:MAG: Molybdopterin oxidoreductase [Myxococcales bacterium]|nr:Molybdopterin oxidoreductase [Myxococcales bacterium]